MKSTTTSTAQPITSASIYKLLKRSNLGSNTNRKSLVRRARTAIQKRFCANSLMKISAKSNNYDCKHEVELMLETLNELNHFLIFQCEQTSQNLLRIQAQLKRLEMTVNNQHQIVENKHLLSTVLKEIS